MKVLQNTKLVEIDFRAELSQHKSDITSLHAQYIG